LLLQEHAIDIADSNPITPVATLRPVTFNFVPKPPPSRSVPALSADPATAAALPPSATVKHAHSDVVESCSTAAAAELNACVVDVPEDWLPPSQEKAQKQADVLPRMHACTARMCGTASRGYFSLHSFAGREADVAAYTSAFSSFAQTQSCAALSGARKHGQHASCASDLETYVCSVTDDQEGLVARVESMKMGMGMGVDGSGNCPACAGDSVQSSCDIRKETESPESTGEAVAACLATLSQGS
jgi:hypothetical protein